MNHPEGAFYFVPHAVNPLLTDYSCTEQFDIGKVKDASFALLLDVSYSNKLTASYRDSYLKDSFQIEKIVDSLESPHSQLIKDYLFQNVIFNPTPEIKEGLKLYIEWYRKNQLGKEKA